MPSQKPIKNVLFFLSDQHRQDTLGCYGNDIVQTPVMDRLAAHGMRFTRSVSPAPTCTPARACIQTGRLAHEHGLIFNPEFCRMNGGRMNIGDEVTFFASLLRDAGYNLAHVGKWHIGDFREEKNTNLPSSYGYEGEHYPGYGFPSDHPHYLEYLKEQGVDGFNVTDVIESQSPHSSQKYAGIQEGGKEASVPSYLANQTIDYLRRYAEADRPFFISCNFWGPHTPYFLPREVYGRYENKDIPVWRNFRAQMRDKPDALRRWGRLWGIDAMGEETLSRLIGHYYDYVTHIDECMGRVISALEESGQLEQTLIVYTADHGASVGSFGMWDKGYGMYENLVNVPMILSHPSFEPGTDDSNVSLLDLAPTFLDVAGLPADSQMRGESLLPLARGEQASVHGGPQVVEHFGHTVPFAQRMVRDKRFKYIFNTMDEDEFYDLESDPDEVNNLFGSGQHGEEIRRLQDHLAEWIEETDDRLGQRWFRTSPRSY